MAEAIKVRDCACPLCRSKSKLLKGNTKRRYFCQKCYIEFTTDGNNKVQQVYEISNSGDLDEIRDWHNYIL